MLKLKLTSVFVLAWSYSDLLVLGSSEFKASRKWDSPENAFMCENHAHSTCHLFLYASHGTIRSRPVLYSIQAVQIWPGLWTWSLANTPHPVPDANKSLGTFDDLQSWSRRSLNLWTNLSDLPAFNPWRYHQARPPSPSVAPRTTVPLPAQLAAGVRQHSCPAFAFCTAPLTSRRTTTQRPAPAARLLPSHARGFLSTPIDRADSRQRGAVRTRVLTPWSGEIFPATSEQRRIDLFLLEAEQDAATSVSADTCVGVGERNICRRATTASGLESGEGDDRRLALLNLGASWSLQTPQAGSVRVLLALTLRLLRLFPKFSLPVYYTPIWLLQRTYVL